MHLYSFFGIVVNEFNDIVPILKQDYIFPEYSELVRVVKTNIDDLRPSFLLEFSYKGKGSVESLQHRRPTFYIHIKLYERKYLNFGRMVFIFALTIRNNSFFSGKITTYFEIERKS